MTIEEAFAIVDAVSGYWPTPAMEPEEVKAWVTVLAGLARISFDEASNVISAESARTWRPRPGQFVELVGHYRRQEALRNPRMALDVGGRICTREENLTNLAALQELLNPGAADQEAEEAPNA